MPVPTTAPSPTPTPELTPPQVPASPTPAPVTSSPIWAKEAFSSLIEEHRFTSNQIEKFKATYQVNAGNFDVEIIKKEKSTIFRCDVYTEFHTSYYDFHWFLRPPGLDFRDDYFERGD